MNEIVEFLQQHPRVKEVNHDGDQIGFWTVSAPDGIHDSTDREEDLILADELKAKFNVDVHANECEDYCNEFCIYLKD